MARYRVTVPVRISVSYIVEADSPDEAGAVDPPVVYETPSGGLAVPADDARVIYMGDDAWDWDALDVVEE